MKSALNCWIVTDDKAGTRAQAQALAFALGMDPVIKTVRVRKLLAWLPLKLIAGWRNVYADQNFDRDTPPDLVIAAGSGAVPAAYQLKQKGARVIFLQDPYIDPGYFDAVIAPDHDQLSGDTIISCIGALSKINGAVLADAAAQWAERLAHFPAPRVAVLIGGTSSVYKIDRATAQHIAAQLQQLQRDYNVSLFVTVSRRTGQAETQILRDTLGHDRVFFWDGTGDNPYAAFLALSDFILVTEDSVSMHSEAAATGKPIYTISLPRRFFPSLVGRGQTSRRFHDTLRSRRITRIFQGKLETWAYEKLDEAKRVASMVQQKLNNKE